MKSGWKTTEFWRGIGIDIISLATALGAVQLPADGVPPWMQAAVQIAGFVALVGNNIAYLCKRNALKISQATPGGLQAPEVTAETAALTKSLGEALARFNAPVPSKP